MNQILTDEEIREISIDCASVSPSDIYFARVIEAKILKALNIAEPRSYLYKHHYYDGSFVFSHKDTLNGSPCIEAIPLYEHPPAPSAIESQAAEIARINGEYQEACRLVAQMHLSAVGGVVGPKLGVVEDVVALKESHDKYKSLCDQMAYAMEMHGAPFLHHELRYNEALEAWRAWRAWEAMK